jgi:hypothetical protein
MTQSEKFLEELYLLEAEVSKAIENFVAKNENQEIYLIDCLEEDLEERLEIDGFADMLKVKIDTSKEVAVMLINTVGIYFIYMETECRAYCQISDLHSIQDRIKLLEAIEIAIVRQERDGIHQIHKK